MDLNQGVLSVRAMSSQDPLEAQNQWLSQLTTLMHILDEQISTKSGLYLSRQSMGLNSQAFLVSYSRQYLHVRQWNSAGLTCPHWVW